MPGNRILVADDDRSTRQAFRRLLEGGGYEVEETYDYDSTVARLQEGAIDLVLLDVWMPGGTGFDVLEALGETSLPRVIIVTADETPATLLEAATRRTFRLLRKPLDAETLLRVVERALTEVADPLPIEIVSAAPEWVEFLAPCDLVTADRIQNLLEQLEADLPAEVRETTVLAFRELLLNAIEWGGELNPEARVRIACIRTARALEVRISDPGRGFRFEDLPHASAGHESGSIEHVQVREQLGMRPGGFGILMARGFADEVVYNEKRNEVLMIKYLPSRP